METASLFKASLDIINSEPFSPILESDIYNLIHKEIPENYPPFSVEELSELMAFKCNEQFKQFSAIKGNYFSPIKGNDYDAGTNNYSITNENIKYWEYRSTNSKNPVLIARYAGLVYELEEIVSIEKPKFSVVKRYVTALLDLIEQNLFKVPVYAKYKCQRALHVALEYNIATLIQRCKIVIMDLEDKISQNDKPGLWGFSYDFLIDAKKKLLNEEEETILITKLEKRFSELINEKTTESEYALKRLASYYFLKGNKYDLKRVFLEYEKMLESVQSNVFQKIHHLENLFNKFRQFQLNDESKKVLIKIRELSKHVHEEMKVVSSEMEFSVEQIDNYTNWIWSADSELTFSRIAYLNVPSIEEENKRLAELAKEMPLSFMLSNSILDKDGRRVANIRSINEDTEDHLIRQLSIIMRINTVFLHYIFEEGIKRELFNSKFILNFLNRCGFIDIDRLYIIELGLDAYFTKNYITSIHLIIPQFEHSIRKILESSGGNVLIEKNGVFQLKTLEHLLNEPIIKDIFGTDWCYYFKALFTDKRAWNLRNDLAHGMMNIEEFSKQNADRLIHAIMCLACIRKT